MKKYEECQDDELIRRLRDGDDSVMDYLMEKYKDLVRRKARLMYLPGADQEDLIQEGMIGLLSAIRGFEPGKEAGFRTYAEVCIRNRLRSAIKAAARDKHTPLNHSVSLGTPLFDGNPEPYAYGPDYQRAENPEDMVISREERQGRMQALRGRLSSFERTVMDLYLDGLSYAEIASQAGKPLKSVDNAVQRIRRKVAPFFSSGDISVS